MRHLLELLYLQAEWMQLHMLKNTSAGVLQHSPGEAAAGGSASLAAGALSASELPLAVRTATEAAATPRLLAVPPAT